MKDDTTAPASLIDDGAIEPPHAQVAIAAALSYFWVGVLPGAIVPAGLIITLFRLGSITGAVTWKARLRFGKRVLIASMLAATVGYLVRAGFFLVFEGSNVRFSLKLL